MNNIFKNKSDMNTKNNLTDFSSEEIFWAKVSAAVSEFDKEVSKLIIKEFFKDKSNNTNLITGFLCFKFCLRIANSYIMVQQFKTSDENHPLKILRNQKQQLLRQRQKIKLLTLKDLPKTKLLTLKRLN